MTNPELYRLIHLPRIRSAGPVSILSAWSAYLVVDSAFAAFGERTGFGAPHAWTTFYVIVALLALEIMCAIYAFSALAGDFAACITMTWALYGHIRRFPDAQLLNSATDWAVLVSLVLIAKSARGFYIHKCPAIKNQLIGCGIALESEEY
ncbi:hypothetical protein FRB94_012920 [Tulasnella sp. JGI-2019a]|nr:hypothetical protein FRB94_012920 [Tulasnella sp. JGI-2019a]